MTEPKPDVSVEGAMDTFAAVDDLEASNVETHAWLESVTTMAWNVCGLLPVNSISPPTATRNGLRGSDTHIDAIPPALHSTIQLAAWTETYPI